jgi:hypothetical protein
MKIINNPTTIKKCKLPKHHPEYYDVVERVNRKTGEKKEKQIYPNIFNDLISIQGEK